MTAKPGQYGIEHLLSGNWRRPGYWKTLAGLRAGPSRLATVAIEGSSLRFIDCPFEPASVFPTGLVAAEQIEDINLGNPSEVRLRSGEVLHVAHAGKDALLTFVNRYAIKVRNRLSIWTALLDPFLDTWEEQSVIDAQFAWLAAQGIDREAVDRWRKEVAPAMVAYNFGAGLWEWVSLGLDDVLRAQHARLSKSAFADFYERAMQVARLDPVREGALGSGDAGLQSALFSVLIDWYPRDDTPATQAAQGAQDRFERVKSLSERLSVELTEAYSQSTRRYHTLEHIEHCLKELAQTWNYTVHLNEVRWAIVFHDAIYDSQRKDNEARSADWACKVMHELQRPQDEQARVRALILATAHVTDSLSADECLLLDIDLSILGADQHIFDEYDRAIRYEYSWVPESDYRSARARVLESFLQRKPIYQTSLFRERLESQARLNLGRAIDRLRNVIDQEPR